MEIICKHCRKTIEISKEIMDNYYNWKCPNCNSFIQLKGSFVPIWNCETGTYKKDL